MHHHTGTNLRKRGRISMDRSNEGYSAIYNTPFTSSRLQGIYPLQGSICDSRSSPARTSAAGCARSFMGLRMPPKMAPLHVLT